MLVRIKRQNAINKEIYWQTFEYNNSNENATVVTVLNALNYTDDPIVSSDVISILAPSKFASVFLSRKPGL